MVLEIAMEKWEEMEIGTVRECGESESEIKRESVRQNVTERDRETQRKRQ